MLEFQSLLKQNDLKNKPIFLLEFELQWGHIIIQRCFVPLLSPFSLFFVNVIVFCKMDCVSSMKIKVKPTQTLESFVACWQHLNMACPQHDPTNSVVLIPTPHLKQEKSNNGHGQRNDFPCPSFFSFCHSFHSRY